MSSSEAREPGDAVLRELAPTGVIRAAINLGNPVLAREDTARGDPEGASVDIAREIGRRTGLPVRFASHESAGRVVDALAHDEWDVAFLANEPARADRLVFSTPYVVIEGTYMVWRDAPYASTSELDAPGIRISVALNAAYDLHLTRALRHAEIRRGANPVAALEMFYADRLEAGAGVRQALKAFAVGKPDVRILDDAFMSIRQTVASRPGRPAASAWLDRLVAELKASGWMRATLDRNGQGGAQVAP